MKQYEVYKFTNDDLASYAYDYMDILHSYRIADMCYAAFNMDSTGICKYGKKVLTTDSLKEAEIYVNIHSANNMVFAIFNSKDNCWENADNIEINIL